MQMGIQGQKQKKFSIGLFAKIEIDKSINNRLEIRQNAPFGFKKDKLEMDDQNFEKYFDVTSKNKIIGMQILTADVMEELVDFEKNSNMRYDIYIDNNIIYLRFNCGNVFETPKLKKGPLNREYLQIQYNLINFTYILSRELIKVIHETEI
jgi:hypothetical protein